MNAATLTVRDSAQGGREMSPVSLGGDILSSRLGVRLRQQRCPSCDSIIYSRRHNRCGVCERELPVNFLFTSDEAEKVDVLLRTERERHRAWLTRVEVGTQ